MRHVLFLTLALIVLGARAHAATDAPVTVSPPPVVATGEAKVIEISTAEELVANVGPNRTLRLQPGTYNLSLVKELPTRHVAWREEFDGKTIVFKELINFSIEGVDPKQVNVIVLPRYADALSFKNCQDIKVKNLTAGHKPEKGTCAGDVISFETCTGVEIENCDLFGSGAYGITLNDVRKATVRNSIIRECTYGIMTLDGVENVRFDGCSFHDNREYDLITIADSNSVIFANCQIYNNVAGSGVGEGHLFSATASSNITVQGCSIRDNTVGEIAYPSSAIEMVDTIIEEQLPVAP